MDTPLFKNPVLNINQASVYMGNTPPSSIRQYTAERRLPCYKPGKIVLYRQSDLDAFVEASRRASFDQLNQELEQKRQELNTPAPSGATDKRGGRSCNK